MKNLERAVRLYRALYESPVKVTSASARSWPKVSDAIAHDGGLLMEMESLKPSVRENVLSILCEMSPLNESSGPSYIFPDESKARLFVNEVTRSGGHATYLDAGTMVAADMDGMDEVVATAAATFGGAPCHRTSVAESVGRVDLTLMEDMLAEGLDPRRVEESVIDALYRASNPTAPKPLNESQWIGMDSAEHINKFKGRLEEFCKPKHVLGVPAYLAEAVRVAGMAPPHLMNILEGSPPGVQPGGAAGDPAQDPRGGVAKDQPDANAGSTAQSQNGEQQAAPQPTEHVPAQEQGAAGAITLSNGMQVPPEVIAQAMGKMLHNLATQVEQGVPQSGVPQKGPGTTPPAVQAAQEQGASQQAVGALADPQNPAGENSAQPEGSQPQEAPQGAPQDPQAAPAGQEAPPAPGQEAAPEDPAQAAQPNPEIDTTLAQAENGDQEALKKAQGMQGQMTDEQKQKLQALLATQNGTAPPTPPAAPAPAPQQESMLRGREFVRNRLKGLNESRVDEVAGAVAGAAKTLAKGVLKSAEKKVTGGKDEDLDEGNLDEYATKKLYPAEALRRAEVFCTAAADLIEEIPPASLRDKTPFHLQQRVLQLGRDIARNKRLVSGNRDFEVEIKWDLDKPYNGPTVGGPLYRAAARNVNNASNALRSVASNLERDNKSAANALFRLAGLCSRLQDELFRVADRYAFGLGEGTRGKPQHGVSGKRLQRATGKTSSDRDRKGKGRYSRPQAGGGRKGDSSDYGFKKSIRKEPMSETVYAKKHEGRGTSVWEPLSTEGTYPGACLPEGLDYGSGEIEPGALVMVTESGESTSRIFTAEGLELRVANEHLSDVGTFHILEGGRAVETMNLRELIAESGIQDVALVVGTPTSGKSHYLRRSIGAAVRESVLPPVLSGLVDEQCVVEAVQTATAWTHALNEDRDITEADADNAMAEVFGSVAHQLFFDRESEALIQLGETLIIDGASLDPRATPYSEILEACEGMDVLLIEMRTPLNVAQERNEMRLAENAPTRSELVRAHNSTRRMVNELWSDPRVTHRATYEWIGEDALDGEYVTEGAMTKGPGPREKRQIGKRTDYDIDGEDPKKPTMRKMITVESLMEGFDPTGIDDGQAPQLNEQLDVGQAAEGESAAKAMLEAGVELKKAREAIFSLTTAKLVQVSSMAKASGMKRSASAAEAAMTAASSLLDDLQKVGQLLDKANETMKGENNGRGGDTADQANGAAPPVAPGAVPPVPADPAAAAVPPVPVVPEPANESTEAKAISKLMESEVVTMILGGAHHGELNEAVTALCPELSIPERASVINRLEFMTRVPQGADIRVNMAPRDRDALNEAVTFTSGARPLLERLTFSEKTLATRHELDEAVKALKAHGGLQQLLVADSLSTVTPSVSS